MELAEILLIAACVAAGVTGAVASTWRLRSGLYRLELDVREIQTKQLSLVRGEAAKKRWDKQDILEEAKKLASVSTVPQRNPWDM